MLFQRYILQLQEEQEKMRQQEESFFKELDFDYDDSVDGKRGMNQLLS